MIQLNVNAVAQQFDGDPEMPLLWYLRDVLQLTGTKYGCGIGLCGACTVHVDGAAARSCLLSMTRAAGKSVVTIEGLCANVAEPWALTPWVKGGIPARHRQRTQG